MAAPGHARTTPQPPSVAPSGAVGSGVGSRPDHVERGQRRRRHIHVFASRRAVRVCAVVVAGADDHCALCDRRYVRAHGGGYRQRAFRPDPGGVWLSPDIFCDGRRIPRGLGERSGGVRRRGFGGGNIRDHPVYRCADRRANRLGARAARNLSAGGENFLGALLVLSRVPVFRFSGTAGLARCGSAHGDSHGAVQ